MTKGSTKGPTKRQGLDGRRYTLVDAATGDDLREAHDVEIEDVMRSANFSGVATIEIGDRRRSPAQLRAVTIRLVNAPADARLKRIKEDEAGKRKAEATLHGIADTTTTAMTKIEPVPTAPTLGPGEESTSTA
jgi:hypothetical protein